MWLIYTDTIYKKYNITTCPCLIIYSKYLVMKDVNDEIVMCLTFMLHLCCIYVAFMLYLCCIYVVFMLHLCCIYVAFIPFIPFTVLSEYVTLILTIFMLSHPRCRLLSHNNSISFFKVISLI